MSQLHFEVSVDTSGLRRGIKESNKTIGDWAANAQKNGLAVDNTFGMLQKRFLQFASIHFARQIGNEIIQVRGEFQQLGIAFETMLGSKAKADQIMSEAITFAQKTPFTLTDVASNIKQLMAMGIATEKVMDTMKSLGDVAAGVSVPLQRVAINYGQVATLGVLQGRELRDFAMAGIPLIDELAKNLGKAKNEIQEMVSAGQIGFKDVEKAFQTMAGEGGKFYNLMEKQNASVTGQISNLQDKIEVMLNSIGKSNEGLIYGGISGLSNLVENYQQVLDILKLIVATYGTYKAASIVVTLLREAEAAGTLAAALRRTALAQMFLNTAQKASPVGLALAGITALIGGYAIWQKHVKQTGAFTADLNKSITDEILKLDSLFKKLKSAGEGTKERADAIKLANDRYGSYLDNLLTEKSTLEDLETAQRNATNALIANISVQKSKDKLSEVLGDVSEKFDKEFSDFVQKYGEVYGTDRIPEFVVAINDAIDKKIKAGGGQVKRGMLEFSDIAKDVYDEFVKEISQKTGFLEYDFKSFQDSFLDFAEFKSEKSGFVAQLEGMITAYQGIINKFKKDGTGDEGGETSKEVEDIKKQISSLYEVLQTADEKDRRAIAERIVALQKELLLREMIAETAVKAVRDQQVPGKIKPIQPTVKTNKTQSGKTDSGSLIDWVSVFGDLDRISTDALIDLRNKLKKYLGQIDDDISKEDFKELTDAFRAINESIEGRDPFGTISDAMADLKFYTAKVEIQKKIVEQKKQEGATTQEILAAEKDLLAAQNGRSESLAKISNGINQIGRDGAELVSAIREYTDMLENFGVDIGDQGREIVDGVGQIMNGLESIDLTKPFTIVTGAIKAMAGIGNVIASLLGGGDSELSQKTFDRYDDLMATMDDLISKQKELLDSMAGAEAKGKYDESIELINKQIDATKKLGQEWLNSGSSWKSHSHGYNLRKTLGEYANAFDAIGIDFDDLGGRMEGLFDLSPEQLQSIKEEIPEAWARIDDRTREYLQNIINGKNEIEEMRNQLNETLTGISFDAAKDSLQDLLLDADATMADLADNFEKYMLEAIVGTLIDGPLKAKIQEWYTDFAEAMDDGILDKNEKEQLRKMYEAIFKEGQSLRDMAFSAAGLDFGADAANQAGLSGAIRREMTEETAGELAGIWRRSSDDTRQIRDYTKAGIDHLIAIEANTYNTVVELQKAVSKLDTLDVIAANTKPAQSSRDMGL